jgi:hypothetical protein
LIAVFVVVVVVVCSSVWLFGSHLAIAGVKSLRVSPKCTSHIIEAKGLWVISSSERPQQNKTSPSHLPVLILPEFHCVNRCEGRKFIVLGMYNASLLSSLPQLLLLLLLFVPQYGCLAAI